MGGNWKAIKDEDIQMNLTGFLQRNNLQSTVRISTSIVNDTLLNLKSDVLAGLPGSQYTMPCFLSDGRSAEEYMRFTNGIINLHTLAEQGESNLFPNTHDFFSDKVVKYAYDPDAKCPMWEEYLNTTFDDPEMREAIRNMFWYILTGIREFNVGFFLVGNGGDGKSTAVHILQHLIGSENVCSIPFSDIGKNFYTHSLTTHKLNLVEELNVSDAQGNIGEAEKTFKIATDGGLLLVEKKFENITEARAKAKFVFCTNSIPAFTDKSKGLWDRIVILPFEHRFRDTPAEKRSLKYDLESELPGIFNWVMEGGKELLNVKRFPVPERALKAREKYRLNCDHEEEFLRQNFVVDHSQYLVKSALYDCYKDWMNQNNYRPVGAAKFNEAVIRCFPDTYEKRIRTPKDCLVWNNLALSNDNPLQEYGKLQIKK